MSPNLFEGKEIETCCSISVAKLVLVREAKTALISEIYRELTHPPFQSQSPRRLLLSQYTNIIPALRI